MYHKGRFVTPIDKFTIQKHEGQYEDWPLTSLIYFEGQVLESKVPGFVIEKQFELINYYLLLLSWDCPFEEGCEVVVLNRNFDIVGSHSFTPFYNSYALTSIEELSQNHYKLVFNNSDNFEMSVFYPKKNLFSKVVSVSRISV